MLPDEKVKCPATGFKKRCRDIVVECTCPKFVHVRGRNPNTGEDIDHHGCIDTVQHILTLENTAQLRSVTETLQNFQNEMVSSQFAMLQMNGKPQLEGPGDTTSDPD